MNSIRGKAVSIRTIIVLTVNRGKKRLFFYRLLFGGAQSQCPLHVAAPDQATLWWTPPKSTTFFLTPPLSFAKSKIIYRPKVVRRGVISHIFLSISFLPLSACLSIYLYIFFLSLLFRPGFLSLTIFIRVIDR